MITEGAGADSPQNAEAMTERSSQCSPLTHFLAPFQALTRGTGTASKGESLSVVVGR